MPRFVSGAGPRRVHAHHCAGRASYFAYPLAPFPFGDTRCLRRSGTSPRSAPGVGRGPLRGVTEAQASSPGEICSDLEPLADPVGRRAEPVPPSRWSGVVGRVVSRYGMVP